MNWRRSAHAEPDGFCAIVDSERTLLTPILRIGYRWRDKITFEFEAGTEKGKTTTSTQTEETSLGFYTLGYRWDF